MKGRKLGRTTSHRLALFRNQLHSLLDKERIVTTLPKAKELRPIAERVITRAKTDSVPARRWVRTWVPDRGLVSKVFATLGPRFVDRPGGYTRIVKLGFRPGDGAELAVLEFVDYQPAPKAAPAEKGAKGDKAEKDESGEKAGEGKAAAAKGKARPKTKPPSRPKPRAKAEGAEASAKATEPKAQTRKKAAPRATRKADR
jgi:large subunit ribosomal protein L17